MLMFVSVTQHQSNRGNGSKMTTTSKQVGIFFFKKWSFSSACFLTNTVSTSRKQTSRFTRIQYQCSSALTKISRENSKSQSVDGGTQKENICNFIKHPCYGNWSAQFFLKALSLFKSYNFRFMLHTLKNTPRMLQET